MVLSLTVIHRWMLQLTPECMSGLISNPYHSNHWHVNICTSERKLTVWASMWFWCTEGSDALTSICAGQSQDNVLHRRHRVVLSVARLQGSACDKQEQEVMGHSLH